jgi:hypothetical protein
MRIEETPQPAMAMAVAGCRFSGAFATGSRCHNSFHHDAIFVAGRYSRHRGGTTELLARSGIQWRTLPPSMRSSYRRAGTVNTRNRRFMIDIKLTYGSLPTACRHVAA